MNDFKRTQWNATSGRRGRWVTLAVVALFHAAALLILLTSPPEAIQRVLEQPMQLIVIRPPLPPKVPEKPRTPPVEPHKTTASPPPAEHSPAPKPPPTPLPIAVAAVAKTDLSSSTTSGMSLGTIGTGLDLGIGGASGGGGLARHAEWVGGGIGNNDYPDAAKRARLQGVVDVRFTVHVDGRVSGCTVDHSSGSAELDRLTCALVEQRLLYNPALDAAGKPVEEVSGRRFRYAMTPRRN